MNFFAELKRRNVFRVGIAYVIVGWLVAQVAQLAAESFGAPAWVMKMLLTVLVIGFPLALLFAWAFELTAEGLKRESQVDRSQSVTRNTGRKLDRAIIVVLLLTLGWFAWDRFLNHPPAPTAGTPSVASEPAKSIPQAEAPSASQPSIAVLPFVNMSADPDNEYFSDGISEEILNVLSRIPELKVAARTSAFAYKGSNAKVAQIARELGVNHVLEGSVRKAGDQVRITAQLIQADNGFHLWSETYDRQLTNIFAIQDEIAAAIAQSLKVTLSLESGKSGNRTGTASVPAYEHYLQGMSLWHQRTAVSLHKAIEEFEAAIAIDPDFARAYAGLALAWAVIEGYEDISSELTHQQTQVAAKRALELDPDNVEALAALGVIARYDSRYEDALRLFHRAIALNPSFATAHQWLGGTLGEMGDPEAGLASYREAWSLDPRSRIIGYNLALRMWRLGHRQEAHEVLNDVLQFAPEFPDAVSTAMSFSIIEGHCEQAAEYANRLASLMKKPPSTAQVYGDLCQTGDPARRQRAVQEMLSWEVYDPSNPDQPSLIFIEDMLYLFTELGRFEDVWALLDKRPMPLNYYVATLRTLRSENGIRLQCSERYVELSQQVGLPPPVDPVDCSAAGESSP